MAARQENARTVAAVPGEAVSQGGLRRNFTGLTSRRPPAYARQFNLTARQVAVVRAGWPMRRPPAAHELAVPDGEAPDSFDWSMLAGRHVFICSATGQIADHELLRALGVDLVAAGVLSAILFDGERVVAEWWADAAERPGGAA